jgi:hypothetical protein
MDIVSIGSTTIGGETVYFRITLPPPPIVAHAVGQGIRLSPIVADREQQHCE